MRLKSIWISNYKNLREFTLDFDGENFLDIFVGKNGTGKSNFFEALVEVFRHIFESRNELDEISFDYQVTYEIDGADTVIALRDGNFSINGQTRRTIGRTPVPDNVLIYYSGHNDTIRRTVDRYAHAFARRSQRWENDETRKFIRIGPEYKELLLSVLLMQSEDCVARRYLCEKLMIELSGETATLELKRPSFARVDVDVADPETFLWGAKGISREFLDRLTACIKDGFSPGSIYDRARDAYTIPINLDLFADSFGGASSSEVFRSFDNLMTLGMFGGLSMPLRLGNRDVAQVGDFSDGQFQSVYIFAISELFKDRNCITLLDEPDSFLHPEWQFGFLKQVSDIAGTQAAQTNHVLLSSHSASTIAKSDKPEIRMFDFGDEGITVTAQDKSSVIKSLSSGLITFSEREAKLSIYEILENTDDAVLFTEGLSDKIILDAAIAKLFPNQNIGLVVQGAFDRNLLSALLKRDELSQNYPGRKFYALFDFDEAYNDWNGLRPATIIQDDPHLGLGKRLDRSGHCAFLLPVPRSDTLRRQALNAQGEPFEDGSASLTIELLFCDENNLGDRFAPSEVVGGGEIIKFRGNKIDFANQAAAQYAAEKFQCLRPLLEFIRDDIRT